MPEPSPSIEALLAHAPWVRRLARALVGPERAEDLAQDVWVAALRRPPEAGGSLRGWLARVALNRARQDRRAAGRRAERERRAAVPEATDDPSRRFDLHRDLVELVAELDEPWRRTILRRYFDGLPLAEIAEADGLPLSTVNSRLRRGRELLRARLDEASGGDRRAWALALAPLVRDPETLAPWTTTALAGIGAPLALMKLPQLVAVLVLAAGAAYLLLPASEESVAPPPAGAVPEQVLAQESLPATREEPSAPSEPESARRAVEEPARMAATPVEETAAVLLQGRVVDTHGAAMAGLEVWCSRGGEDHRLGVTGADGGFEVDPERDLGLIEVRDEVWGTALGCRLPRGARRGPTLVVARWIECGGVVRGEAGELVPRAHIAVAVPPTLRASAPDQHDSSTSHEPTTRANELGEFLLPDVLAVEGTSLYVEAQGYELLEVEMPAVSTRGFEIVLRRPAEDGDVVRGRVVDAAGSAVEGAWVSLGHLCVQTEADGGFVLDRGREGEFDRLVAAFAGQTPAVMERPKDSASGADLPWPDFVVLQLGPAPLELAGRLVDAAGEPLAGWRLWPGDATFFSGIDQRGVTAEGLALGLLDARDEDEGPTATWPWAETDEDGRFVLGGLLDRDYALRVNHEPSLLLADVGTYAAGRHDLEIVLDLGELYGPVAGRVVDPDGAPLPGVSIETWVTTYTMPHGEAGFLLWGSGGETAVTDEDGRYRIERLPRTGLQLRVKHPDILPEELELRRGEDGEPVGRSSWEAVDFRCQLRFHVQVEVPASLASRGSLVCLGAEGEEALIQVFSAGGHMSTHRYYFEQPKSEVLSLSGDVREIVLFDEEQRELARRPLELVFGELNIVRF